MLSGAAAGSGPCSCIGSKVVSQTMTETQPYSTLAGSHAAAHLQNSSYLRLFKGALVVVCRCRPCPSQQCERLRQSPQACCRGELYKHQNAQQMIAGTALNNLAMKQISCACMESAVRVTAPDVEQLAQHHTEQSIEASPVTLLGIS